MENEKLIEELEARIDAAETDEEVAAILAEAGLEMPTDLGEGELTEESLDNVAGGGIGRIIRKLRRRARGGGGGGGSHGKGKGGGGFR